jgi:ubiquinol-cytochrome c reductase cytochrome b subunit
MGLAIGYAVGLSIPIVGANLTLLVFGTAYPGYPAFWSRMYIAHVLLLPILIAALLGVHLALVASRHHTQFRRKPVQSERKLLGVPTFPGQMPRSLGLFCAVAGVLFLLGGLVQINPIWLWGPYHVGLSTNGAQPDWYLGWLIGALRLVPSFDLTVGQYTLVPNPFWGGALFPMLVFAALYAWPWIERRVTGDHGVHNVLERPRDNPWRTGMIAALATEVFIIFLAGSADRVTVFLGVSYVSQIWAYRALVFLGPPIAFFVTRAICRALQHAEEVEEIQEEAEHEGEEAPKAEAEVVA